MFRRLVMEKVKCSKCNGTGKCPTCGGTGYIISGGIERSPERGFENQIERKCPACGGTGKCHSCDGTGYIEK
jgi:DnaJ-class molecular chaperone